MAELTTSAAEPAATSSCCSAEAQASCCEPSEKASCCGEAAVGGSCGCLAGGAAGVGPVAVETEQIRETVREKYAAAARAAAASSSCCGPISLTDADEREVFGAALYDGAEIEGATRTAVAALVISTDRRKTSAHAPTRSCRALTTRRCAPT